MHQTAKGQQLCFGIKAQIGVDSKTKLVHTVLASADNVHDREALPYLLHGNETRVRAKVEHVFGVIKNIFGFRKTCDGWNAKAARQRRETGPLRVPNSKSMPQSSVMTSSSELP